jgi:hypothetical protein
MMTTKPKTRKAPAADPIFAAIAEHKLLIKEFGRREDIYRTARSKAEKDRGWSWTDNAKRSLEALDLAKNGSQSPSRRSPPHLPE